MSLRVRLLRAALRRRLAALLAAGALLASLGALTVSAASEKAGNGEEASAEPRAILGRVWFDAYPTRRSDEVTAFIWLGGGIGIVEEGSVFRYKLELFEFERRVPWGPAFREAAERAAAAAR